MHAEVMTFKKYSQKIADKLFLKLNCRTFVLEILGVHIKASQTSGSLPLHHTVFH